MTLCGHSGQPGQKPVRGCTIQGFSVCSLPAKEDTTFPGQVISSRAVKQLWIIHTLPKLALTLQLMVGYLVNLVKETLCSEKGMDWLYFHFWLVFQRKFRQSRSCLLAWWSTRAQCEAGCSEGSCVSCAMPLQHFCVTAL